MTTKNQDDVVEDSEPEREMLRQKEREERRKKKRLSKQAKIVQQDTEVIELTDEDSRPLDGVVRGSVIELSEDNSSSINVLIMESTLKSSTAVQNNGQHLGRTGSSNKGIDLALPQLIPLHASNVIELSGRHGFYEQLTSGGNIGHSEDTTYTPRLSIDSHRAPEPRLVRPPATNALLSPQGPFLGAAIFSNSVPSASEISNGSDSESNEIDANLNLARFAYNKDESRLPLKAPQPRAMHFQLAGGSGSSSGLPLPGDLPLKKKSKRGASHRFTADFSDNELVRLMKCVSCDIRWTTRKTVAQKMTHVQSCAQKNAFTDETVRVLIRKEIDNALVEPLAKGKGKGKGRATSQNVNHPPVAPKTFFEEVVDDAIPRKKIKGQGIAETVKSVTVTRDDILDRARAVLGLRASSLRGDDFSIRTQAFGGNRLTGTSQQPEGCQPLPTQIFGRSALAERHRPNATSRDSPGADDRDVDLMPATQHFAPSKLGASLQPRPISGGSDSTRDPGLSPVASRPTIATENLPLELVSCSTNAAPLFNFATSSGREHALQYPIKIVSKVNEAPYDPTRQTPSQKNDSKEKFGPAADNVSRQYAEVPWDNDDAYLHFDPDFDQPNQYELHNDTATKPEELNQYHSDSRYVGSPTQVTKPRRTIKNNDGNDESDSSTSKNSKGKKKEQDCVDSHDKEVDNENWEHRMKCKILQDQVLYLRILRYEPIDFSVFLKLAADEPSQGLKWRLRSFLDKQAINFYGIEPTGRRH